jgi:glycosyltransferase involved in cell wall biosynthesis
MFGPYHVARLNSVADRYDLVGLEGSAASDTYAWEKVVGADRFRRVTLFKNAPISQMPTAEVIRRMDGALDAERPDVVVVPGWSSTSGFAMLSWAQRMKVPAIVMSESTMFDFQRSWWREAIKRRIVKAFAAAVVGGQHHARYLAALGMPRSRIFIGYDAVDNFHFECGSDKARSNKSRLRAQLGLPDYYFLASARFVAKKNLGRLIEAFSVYRRTASTNAFHLVLLGDGELRKDIERQIASLGLASQVHLLGFKQYNDLPIYYGLASAFIHSSTMEQWGLVVNEAMASGLPVVVSNRCGCVPDLVHNGRNGITFDPLDVEALAAAMSRVADPSCDRETMGKQGRDIVSAFGPAAFATGLSTAVEVSLSTRMRSMAGTVDRAIVSALRWV